MGGGENPHLCTRPLKSPCREGRVISLLMDEDGCLTPSVTSDDMDGRESLPLAPHFVFSNTTLMGGGEVRGDSLELGESKSLRFPTRFLPTWAEVGLQIFLWYLGRVG